MVKNRLLVFAFCLFATLTLIGFGSAAPIFSSAATINNIDNFYSPSEYINFTVTTTAAGPDNATLVQVNLTSVNATACDGLGYLNLTNTSALGAAPVTWIGGCAVSTLFNNSIINPVAVNGGNFSFIAFNASGDKATTSVAAPIFLHNLGVPNMSDPTGCTRFGSKTTNLSSPAITNFANVSYYALHIQINFTCLTGGAFRGAVQDEFNDAALLNMTSINMSASDIGTKLSNLRTTVQVNITAPETFGASRINVNTTAFNELNTGARVKLYYIPIIYWDILTSFTGENIGKLNGVGNDGANGYLDTLGVSSWNITLDISGFSGYNITDNKVPTLSLNAPAASTYRNNNSVYINVSVNTTGTEASRIAIRITNSSGVEVNLTAYNSTLNSANCQNTTLGGDFYNCLVNVTNLPRDGEYTINVTAWDYGGANPGNSATTTRTFTVDTTYPRINLTGPADDEDWDSSLTVTFDYNVTDAAVDSCVLVIDDVVADTDSSPDVGANSISEAVSDTGYYDWYINCTDMAGLTNTSEERTVHVTYDSGDGGGGGGDGASYTPSFWTNTYGVDDDEFAAGYNKMLGKGNRFRVKVDNETHYVGVISLGSTSITINVSSDPQQATLAVGETKKFEVSGDDYYDISVKLNSINGTSSKANITVTSVHEKISTTSSTTSAGATANATRNLELENETLGEELKEAITGEEDSAGSRWLLWVIIILVVVAAAGAAYYFLVMRKDVSKRVKTH